MLLFVTPSVRWRRVWSSKLELLVLAQWLRELCPVLATWVSPRRAQRAANSPLWLSEQGVVAAVDAGLSPAWFILCWWCCEWYKEMKCSVWGRDGD